MCEKKNTVSSDDDKWKVNFDQMLYIYIFLSEQDK